MPGKAAIKLEDREELWIAPAGCQVSSMATNISGCMKSVDSLGGQSDA